LGGDGEELTLVLPSVSSRTRFADLYDLRCFSAEASFGAAVVITTIGVISYKKAKGTPYWALSIIPIFFGIQQLFEGFVWVASVDDRFSGILRISTYGFIFFAWVVWPIFIPYALWKPEKHKIRKIIFRVLTFVGASVAVALVIIMFQYGVQAQVEDCSLAYKTNLSHPLADLGAVLYLVAVVLSSFFSSNKRIWILGVLNLVGFAISRIYFLDHIISIWCFFAALFSVAILWVIVGATREIEGK